MPKARKKVVKKKAKPKLPIAYWSYSGLMAYLRNPLTWYKRYVQKVYDLPRSPSAVIGSAGHYALEQFYGGADKETAIRHGLEQLRACRDEDLNFGVAKTKKAKKAKRASMEREYLQAIGYYLDKPPRHKVVAIEMRGMATVEGLPLPVKAISDLVVESRAEPGALDIVDHKFVDTFSKSGADKPLFMMQAIFNYYTVLEAYGRPVRRFMVIECKKTKNANGRPQLRRYVLDYNDAGEAFAIFHRLITDATAELLVRKSYLPNPSDMFEGEHSFDLYRLGLGAEEVEEDAL